MPLDESQSNAVADAARIRENTPPRVMTIAEAVDWARWARKQPDGYLSPDTTKRVVDTLFAVLESSPSYLQAKLRGQEVFVLVQQDRAAPAAIVAWAEEAETHGCGNEKVNEAYRLAGRWRDQPDANTKWPD